MKRLQDKLFLMAAITLVSAWSNLLAENIKVVSEIKALYYQGQMAGIK